MRVLFAADEYPYSVDAIHQVERLGQNTWADITILGIAQTPRINRTLDTLEKDFLSSVSPKAVPYGGDSAFTGTCWNGVKKKVKTRVRSGAPAAEIIKEARSMDSDLIVIGGASHSLNWLDDGNVPLKVARKAECSVLAIKKDKSIQKVLCCLDHDHVTQASLEMVNQMVTLFHAELEIAVLTHGHQPDEKVQQTLSDLFTRYARRGTIPTFQLVRSADFKAFLSRQPQSKLLALWMGKTSVLNRLFPDRKAATLLGINAPSVLFLK